MTKCFSRWCAVILLFLSYSAEATEIIKDYNGYRSNIEPRQISVGNKNQWSFNIPEQCDTFLKQFDEIWDTGPCQAGINDLIVTHQICNFYNILLKGNIAPKYDFISDYNFFESSLDDLPYKIECDMACSNEEHEFCEKLRKENATYSFLDIQLREWSDDEKRFVIPIKNLQIKRDLTNCRLKDMEFSGYISVKNNELKCIRTEGDWVTKEIKPNGEELIIPINIRINRIGFSDINNDGYLDALIHLVYTGSASSFAGSLIGVTRFNNDQTKFKSINFIELNSW